jgi:hypothetical protein
MSILNYWDFSICVGLGKLLFLFILFMNDSDLEILDNIHQDWTHIHEDFS